MSRQNHGNSFQEISFNKQATEDDSNHHSNYETFNTQTTSKEKSIQSLNLRIKQLQTQLSKQKEKNSQLQKRNQQLTDMLVSASQSSVKRNELFIKEVQRKICNFKAVKELSSSSFGGFKQNEEKEPAIRMMTEAGFESSKKLSMTNRQAHQSKTKFDSNKQNSNHLNDRMKTETDKFSKSKYSPQELSSSQLRLKERSTLSNFETQKIVGGKNSRSHHLGGSSINMTSKSPILSPFAKNVDVKTFNKLESKLMRM